MSSSASPIIGSWKKWSITHSDVEAGVLGGTRDVGEDLTIVVRRARPAEPRDLQSEPDHARLPRRAVRQSRRRAQRPVAIAALARRRPSRERRSRSATARNRANSGATFTTSSRRARSSRERRCPSRRSTVSSSRSRMNRVVVRVGGRRASSCDGRRRPSESLRSVGRSDEDVERNAGRDRFITIGVTHASSAPGQRAASTA